ncbi:MAG: hypothetical protein HY390_03800 [Deltaproteobacteria bacterium]|nr:hypothetical protein [Deltaproteobacteria bacterium]
MKSSIAILLSICFFFVFWVLKSHAAIPSDVEAVIQQLDWDMTKIGPRGRRARYVAAMKLACLADQGKEERERVLTTLGRLLGHENSVVITAVQRVVHNIHAEEEMDAYRQNFFLRYGAPQRKEDIFEIVEILLKNKWNGIEILHEFYPSREDVDSLNQLSDFYTAQTKLPLTIRLRTFYVHEPNFWEWKRISMIRGVVITDFHVAPFVSTLNVCEK